MNENTAKKRMKLKFDPEKSSEDLLFKKTNKSKSIKSKSQTKIYYKQSPRQRKLFNKCFGKSNFGIGNLINTSEKIMQARQ